MTHCFKSDSCIKFRHTAEAPNYIQFGVDFEAKKSIDEMLDLGVKNTPHGGA
jgi:hypothetical protein